MSCTVCPDRRVSAKIGIGKHGTLLLCADCYNNINTCTIGADATTCTEEHEEQRVLIHKNSQRFAALRFLASQLGERFATVLNLPHNDLNLYKSSEIHYTFPLRVIHPIANSLGLIGMPPNGSGKKRQQSSTDDTGDEDEPGARRTRTEDTPLPAAAMPPKLAARLPLTKRPVVTKQPTKRKVEVEKEEYGPVAKRSIWEFEDFVRNLPQENTEYILSLLNLSSALEHIKLHAAHVPTEFFQLDQLSSSVFCVILGNTTEADFGNAYESGVLLRFVKQLYSEQKTTLLGLLQLRLLCPVMRLPMDIETDIFKHTVSLTNDELVTLNGTYRQLKTDYDAITVGASAQEIKPLKDKMDIILSQIHEGYIPLLSWNNVREIYSAQTNKRTHMNVPVAFVHCHSNVQATILKRCETAFDFSTWQYPVMLHWLNNVLRDLTSISPKFIYTLCNRFIANHKVFCGNTQRAYTSPVFLSIIVFALITRNKGVVTEDTYAATVSIIQILSYWCIPDDFAKLVSGVPTDIASTNLHVNDAPYSATHAILEVVNAILMRHTQSTTKERMLQFCKLLFTKLMPCSATVISYNTYSSIISLKECEESINHLWSNLPDMESDVYHIRMRAILVMMNRIASASIDEILQDTILLLINPTTINEQSSILHCVVHLTSYVPKFKSFYEANYDPHTFRDYIHAGYIPKLHEACLRILQKVAPLLKNFSGAEQTMLLLMSKGCGPYFFVVIDFLLLIIQSIQLPYDVVAEVISNSVASLMSYSSFYRSNTKAVYENFMEVFMLLVRYIGSALEHVVEQEWSGVVILVTYIIQQTPGTSHTLESIFAGVSDNTLQFNRLKYYIRTGDNNDIAVASKILQTLTTSKSSIGKYIYTMIQHNYELSLPIISAVIVTDVILDAFTVDTLLTILQYNRISVVGRLLLCNILTGQTLIRSSGSKCTLMLNIADMYKLVTTLLPRNIDVMYTFTNLPIIDRISVTDLPTEEWPKILDMDNIPFIAALGLTRAQVYMDIVDSFAAKKKEYAHTLTEAILIWLQNNTKNLNSLHLFGFMQKWTISIVASFDQYDPTSIIDVTDLFGGSWLTLLINTGLFNPRNLGVIEALYAHTVSVNLDDLEDLSNVNFGTIDYKILAKSFYKHYVPTLYAAAAAENHTIRNTTIMEKICNFQPRMSAQSFIEQVKEYAASAQLTSMELLSRSMLYNELINMMIQKRELDYRMAFFNECIRNVATVGYALTNNISLLNQNPYALHELMNSISTAVYNPRRKTFEPLDILISRYILLWCEALQAMVYQKPELLSLQSAEHANQTLAHLWLKSLFIPSSADITEYNLITLYYELQPAALLIPDNNGYTPMHIFDELRITNRGPLYVSVNKIMNEMRSKAPLLLTAAATTTAPFLSGPAPPTPFTAAAPPTTFQFYPTTTAVPLTPATAPFRSGPAPPPTIFTAAAAAAAPLLQ